jgi:hypothetical protein
MLVPNLQFLAVWQPAISGSARTELAGRYDEQLSAWPAWSEQTNETFRDDTGAIFSLTVA